MKRGQLRKKDIKPNLMALENWATNFDMTGISPDFVQWFKNQVGEIADRIRSQDYPWAIQSTIQHVKRIMKHHREGFIVSVSRDGTCFTWKNCTGLEELGK